MSTVPDILVLRKTETIRTNTMHEGYLAKIEIYARHSKKWPAEILRDDDQLFPTKQQAHKRENEMADEWKSTNAPPDACLAYFIAGAEQSEE